MVSMGHALSELSHLRQVIVQCRHRDDSDPIVDKLIRVRDKVLVTTIDEYDTLVGELKNGKVPEFCPILPPLWVEKPESAEGESDTSRVYLESQEKGSDCLFCTPDKSDNGQ